MKRKKKIKDTRHSMGTGRRCEKCLGPVNQNMKRTKQGHAVCFPTEPVLIEYYT